MNIVITLPNSLCNAIIKGVKDVEVRKSFPKHFDCKKDLVYVIKKGTNDVVLAFSVRKFVKYEDTDLLWHDFSHTIGVPYVCFDKYANNCKCLYAWIIDRVFPFRPALNSINFLNIDHNHQYFVYVHE